MWKLNFSKLLEELPEAILCMGVSGNILFMNSMCKLLVKQYFFGNEQNIFDIFSLKYHDDIRIVLIDALRNKELTPVSIDLDEHKLRLKIRWSNTYRCFFSFLENINGDLMEKNQLISDAYTDPLTGMVNRRKFYMDVNSYLSSVENPDYGILAIDIDFFKKINDTWGHDAGDEILKNVSLLCNRSLRQSDIFARFGGEEFTAFLPLVSADSLPKVAERMRKEVEAFSYSWGGDTIKCTISIGCALYQPGLSLEQVINLADSALYTAKKTGRNKVVW